MSNLSFLFAIFIVGFLWSISASISPQIVNIYYLSCDDLKAKGSTCTSKMRPLKSSYRIFPEQRMVVSEGLITTFTDCDIYDKEQWICKRSYSNLVMDKGDLQEFPNRSWFENNEAYELATQEYIDSRLRNPQVPWIIWYVFGWYDFVRDWLT